LEFQNPRQKNYDKYRTHYPKQLITRIADLSNGKKAYLDLATGTGILLFQLYSNFSELCVGSDISEAQIKIAQENLQELNNTVKPTNPKIELILCDVYLLADELRSRGIETKFDLITIGSALHWFDTDKLFNYLVQNLLAPEGVVCILGSGRLESEYNVANAEFKTRVHQHIEKFRSVTIPFWKAKIQSELNGFEDFDFSKYFKKVTRDSVVEVQEMSVEDLVGWSKTLSSYNVCLEECSGKEGFVDPAIVLREEIEKDLKEYAESSGEKLGSGIILRKTPMFYIECSNSGLIV